MFIDELENKHGKIGTEEKQWISENVERLGESEKLNFSRELERYKIITVETLKKVYEAVTGKKRTGYYWAVCMDCGTEYDYGLPMCPECFEKGIKCSVVAVKKSEFQPPAKVIRYNKQYLNEDNGTGICYTCGNKKESYCFHFGKENYNCNSLSSCSCARCCIKAKESNKKFAEESAKHNFTYGKPIGAKNVL